MITSEPQPVEPTTQLVLLEIAVPVAVGLIGYLARSGIRKQAVVVPIEGAVAEPA